MGFVIKERRDWRDLVDGRDKQQQGFRVVMFLDFWLY